MRALILFTATLALAQTTADSFVKRMMEFDKNNDEKLTRAEITDERLLDLFDRADTNQDGFVTRVELTTFFAKEQPSQGGRGRGPGPGQLLPPFLRDQLNLTAEQRGQFDALEKEIDAKIQRILTEDQRRQFNQLRRGRGPGPPR